MQCKTICRYRIGYSVFFVMSLFISSFSYGAITYQHSQWVRDLSSNQLEIPGPVSDNLVGQLDVIRTINTINGYTLTEYRITINGSITVVTDESWYQNCSTSDRSLIVSFPLSVLRVGASNTATKNTALYQYASGGYNSAADAAGGDAYFVTYLMTSPDFQNPNNGIVGYVFNVTYPNVTGYVYSVNGPSGVYKRSDGASVYAFKEGSIIRAVGGPRVGKAGSGSDCKFRAGIKPVDIDIPPLGPDPTVVCDFSTSGDIQLGIVDSSSASGRYASIYLYTQCTGDATVTATIQKSGGGNNLLQMGGLNLRVIFDNSSDTKTYSANINQNSQIIWGQVTSVGTLTPGDYSQSMVVYLNYE